MPETLLPCGFLILHTKKNPPKEKNPECSWQNHTRIKQHDQNKVWEIFFFFLKKGNFFVVLQHGKERGTEEEPKKGKGVEKKTREWHLE